MSLNEDQRKAAIALLASEGEDGHPTWREWLKHALFALVDETEGFSGKRPLGNSGWSNALYDACDAHGVSPAQVIEALFEEPVR